MAMRCAAAEVAGVELAVEIPHGQAVSQRVEFGIVGDLGAQRIELGQQMAAHAEGMDELNDRGFLDGVDRGAAGRRARSRPLPAGALGSDSHFTG